MMTLLWVLFGIICVVLFIALFFIIKLAGIVFGFIRGWN